MALAALAVLSAVRMSSAPAAGPAAAPLGMGGGAAGAPDISAMSPAERADRLFNRVMMLSSEGKVDSARFFAPMAAAAIQALAPLDAHRRYDLGLVGLAAGDLTMAAAQADSILAGHATHLLGLALAARVAEARGNVAESRRYREALIAAEPSERARGLQEYTDHDTDLRAVIGSVPAR